MKSEYTLGKYQYSSGTVQLATALGVVGIGYPVLKNKSLIKTVLFAVMGSIIGFSIGAIITPPKRVKE